MKGLIFTLIGLGIMAIIYLLITVDLVGAGSAVMNQTVVNGNIVP